MQKIQERALRFMLKDSNSDYNTLFSKCGIDSFGKSSFKAMAVEIYKILNDKNPEYWSLFSKSSIPYSLRDNNKLIQQKWERPPLELSHFLTIAHIYGIRCQLI